MPPFSQPTRFNQPTAPYLTDRSCHLLNSADEQVLLLPPSSVDIPTELAQLAFNSRNFRQFAEARP